MNRSGKVKIGLVLGAGGIQGGAWLTGGLDALAEETGWDPAEADYVIGTSAGSMIGALCASGVPPWFMVAHSRGETFDGVRDARGRPAATADRAAGARFELERTWPPIGPGSWKLALRSLLNPRRYTPATVFSGWLWRGVFSTEPLKETIRRVVPTGWGPHPNLWIVACDYETGRRTPFGRVDAPRADLADAVAASCAIPGIYHPVTIGDRRFVDGGIYSVSNLDLLRNEGSGSRHLPQPDLHAAPDPRDQPPRHRHHLPPSGLRSPPGQRGEEDPQQRRRDRPHSAHGR